MRDRIQFGLLAIITIVMLIWASYYEHTYNMLATVYEIKGNTVTFADCTDCFWEYTGVNDLCVGDSVTIKFNDAFSMSNRNDDIIISFKKR